MTPHINPGAGTTINSVVIDDSYRERKQHNVQNIKCCHYDVCYMIHAHNKCINDKPTEIPCIFDSRKEINFSRCAPHISAHPPEAQQRIDAAIAYCNQRHFEVEDDDGTIYEVIPKGEIIALLQAGDKE